MNDAAFDLWKQKADSADLTETAVRFGAKLKRAGREHNGPCPACGGTDRFSINPTKRVWNCRGYGGGIGPIDMAMHVAGLSFSQACEALTGEPPPRGQARPLSAAEQAEREQRRSEAEAAQRAREADERAYQDDTLAAATRIWREVRPIAGTLAEAYLLGFGLPVPPGGWPDCLGFHPSLPYPGGQRLPALVARVDDDAGAITGIWREFIGADGKKAAVEHQKLGLGPVAGGAVRLGGDGEKIGVAEGVRTALGAWALIGFSYPVWSLLSTSGFANFSAPMGIIAVDIFPDGDQPYRRRDGVYVPAVPAGRKAAAGLKDRLSGDGIAASVAAEPVGGLDYLDVWRAVGSVKPGRFSGATV